MDTIIENITENDRIAYDKEINDVTERIRSTCHSKRIAVVSSGGTKVKLDAKGEYIIDNFASGWRGVYLTEDLIDEGYFVIFFYRTSSHLPYERNYDRANEETAELYHKELERIQKNKKNLVLLNFDYIFEYLYKLMLLSESIHKLNCSHKVLYIMAAAVSDFYVPLNQLSDNLESIDEDITMHLKTTPKTLGLIKKMFGDSNFVMVSFKLETDESILEQKVIKSFNHSFSDFIVGNVLSTRNKRLYLYHVVLDKHELVLIEKEHEGQGILEQKLVKKLVEFIK